MSFLEAIVLGVIEGVTEFLPISSTGHLTVAEKLMGFNIDDADVTAFTAIIQIGAVAAVVIYFWEDIWGILTGLAAGLVDPRKRAEREFRYGLAVAIGSIPIGIVALVFRHQIEGDIRSLWVVGTALILWSFVMYAADQSATQSPPRERVRHPRRPGHGADPVHRPDPRRLTLRRHDRRRPIP